MKTITEIFGFILFAAIVWHIHVFFSEEKTITGIFETTPKAGYVWTDDMSDEARAFWENTNANWQAGLVHPDYNVVSTSVAGKWAPLPGYVFTDASGEGLSTIWKTNLKHPRLKAYSSETEGKWVPQLGYRFELDVDGNAINTVWDAGRAYEDLKIKASNVVDQFEAFPGYTFINPTENLKVRWTPGLPNPADSALIASTTEGEWVTTDTTVALSEGPQQIMDGVVKAIFANVGEWIFGENDITNAMKEDAAKDVVVGGVKTIMD